MQRTMFSRSLTSSLEDFAHNISVQGNTWAYWSSRFTVNSTDDVSGNSCIIFKRSVSSPSHGIVYPVFFQLTAGETAEFRRLREVVGVVSGDSRSLTVYLWLAARNKLDEFINKWRGIENDPAVQSS